VDGILVTDLVERIEGDGLVALAGAIGHALAPGGVAIVEGLDPAGLGDDGAFWRDPGRRRPVHPDAVRMALESAGLGSTTVEEHGAPGGAGAAAAPALRRACRPLTAPGSPSSSPATAPAWSAGPRCCAG